MSLRYASRCLNQSVRRVSFRQYKYSPHLSSQLFRRTIATSPLRKASIVEETTSQPTILLKRPSPEYLEQEEIDAQILPPEEVSIVITDRAAEQLRRMAAREKSDNAALRVMVESGGCHGYQYKMELAKERAPDDYHFTHPTIQPSNIVVDAVSLGLLNGSTIDFATELIGSSFRILDNPHAAGSGCGCGVSWELKT